MKERIIGLIKDDLEAYNRHLRKLYKKAPEQRTASNEEQISFFNGARWALEQLLRQMEENE